MIDLKMNNIVLHFSVKHVCIEGKELMTTKLTCSVCKDILSHSQVMCAIPMHAALLYCKQQGTRKEAISLIHVYSEL